MLRISDLRAKELINLSDGRRLGYIRDVELDLTNATIKSLVITGDRGGRFLRAEEMVVAWEKIKKVGIDVILVELDKFLPVSREGREGPKEPAIELHPPRNEEDFWRYGK